MATTKKISGYRIDFTTDTLIMNYKFYAASQQYGSPEYNLVKSITKDFPNLTVSVQAGREVTTANKNKRMTYENMKKHIESNRHFYEKGESFCSVCGHKKGK